MLGFARLCEREKNPEKGSHAQLAIQDHKNLQKGEKEIKTLSTAGLSAR